MLVFQEFVFKITLVIFFFFDKAKTFPCNIDDQP